MNGFIETVENFFDLFISVIPEAAIATAATIIGLLTVLALWRHI